jgi:hypothetical protein
MRRKNVLGLLSIAVAAAGCAAFHPMGGSKTTVQREINVSAAGSGCTIDGNVAQIDVTNGNSGTLVFHVKPANAFKFASNGIDFSASGAPAGEFAPVNSSDTTWTIHDRNKSRGTFKYSVHVIPKAPGGVACVLDPTVFNDGTCQDGC